VPPVRRERAEAGVRELVILIEAAGGPDPAVEAVGPAQASRSAEPALAESVRRLAPRHILCGYGGAGERLRTHLPFPDCRVLPAAAGTVRRLMECAADLAARDGDLLVVPFGRAQVAPAALAALREVHTAESNAATLLEEDDAVPPGMRALARDDLGRVTGLAARGAPVPAGRDGKASPIAIFHLPSLAGLCEGSEDPAGEAGGFARAVARLHAAGLPIGAARAPVPGACPRCLENPAQSPATGLLGANRSACLAVERPGFNSGQLVCYPRRHVTCALSLTRDEWDDLAALLREGERLARRVYDFDALNIGLSSGTGAHVAIQLIPRWTGDLNFLPLVSGFKAVPEKPEEAWRRYREAMA